MRIRTGLSPDAWRDDGPARARALAKPYTTINAAVVGEMAVIFVGPLPLTDSDRAKRRRRTEREKAAARDACGFVMRTGVPCARVHGHGDGHASRYAMDTEAARRRSA